MEADLQAKVDQAIGNKPRVQAIADIILGDIGFGKNSA
jgi:hypothetical protein